MYEARMTLLRKAKKQCGNKKRHLDQASADRSVAILNKGGNYFNSYECPYCNRWHIGHIIRKAEAIPGDSLDKCESPDPGSLPVVQPGRR